MTRFSFRSAVLALSSILVAGCATGPVIRRPLVKGTKSLAIIGFSGLVQLDEAGEPHSAVGNLVNGVNTANAVLTGSAEHDREAEATRIYQDLSQRIAQATGWTVLPHDQLASHGQYQQLLAAHPNGGKLWDAIERLPDVLRAEVAKTLDQGQRAQLAQALGVDAIGIVRVIYDVGERTGTVTTVVSHPRALIQLTIYDARTGQPIWEDRYAAGRTTAGGVRNTAGIRNLSGESQLLIEAADSAIDVLIARYQRT